jgi:PKD repeat protein
VSVQGSNPVEPVAFAQLLSATFRYTISSSCVGPVNVTFTPDVVGGSSPYSYLWNFGDGAPSSNVVEPSHLYAASSNGVTITLAVRDSGGNSTTYSDTLEIVYPPCATPSSPWGDPIELGVVGVAVAALLVATVVILARRRGGSRG